MADRDRVTEALRLMGAGAVGDLQIGVEPMVINELIADVLADFLKRAPEARVSLSDVTPDVIIQGIVDGNLDMGCVPFGQEGFAESVTDVCEWYPIVGIDIKLAVPRKRAHEQHPGGKGWGRWILPYRIPAFSGMPDIVEETLADDEGFDVLEVSTPQTAIAFVAAGLGVAPATQRIAEGNEAVALLDPRNGLPPCRRRFYGNGEAR